MPGFKPRATGCEARTLFIVLCAPSLTPRLFTILIGQIIGLPNSLHHKYLFAASHVFDKLPILKIFILPNTMQCDAMRTLVRNRKSMATRHFKGEDDDKANNRPEWKKARCEKWCQHLQRWKTWLELIHHQSEACLEKRLAHLWPIL